MTAVGTREVGEPFVSSFHASHRSCDVKVHVGGLMETYGSLKLYQIISLEQARWQTLEENWRKQTFRCWDIWYIHVFKCESSPTRNTAAVRYQPTRESDLCCENVGWRLGRAQGCTPRKNLKLYQLLITNPVWNIIVWFWLIFMIKYEIAFLTFLRFLVCSTCER